MEKFNLKLLVKSTNGEQKIITICRPETDYTVQELLRDLRIPFNSKKNIECIYRPNEDIEYQIQIHSPHEDTICHQILGTETLQKKERLINNLRATYCGTKERIKVKEQKAAISTDSGTITKSMEKTLKQILISHDMQLSQVEATSKDIQYDQMSDRNANDTFVASLLSEQTKSTVPLKFASPSTCHSKLPTSDINSVILIYPPSGKGGITIERLDYKCLAMHEYLNDVIIDFYLKYLYIEVLTTEQRAKTHIFGSHFYQVLSTLNETRSERIKNWTKNVNLFDKDFIVIPINEDEHWYLAIICFPYLSYPITCNEDLRVQVKRHTQLNTNKRQRDSEQSSDVHIISDDESTEEHTKQPCILIFDSFGTKKRHVAVRRLRKYIRSKYRDNYKLNASDYPCHYVTVPQQLNLSDCGVYLLQYVESFFKKPILSYKFPIKELDAWFPALEAIQKRENISNLIKSLVVKYKGNISSLPDIVCPTKCGSLNEEYLKEIREDSSNPKINKKTNTAQKDIVLLDDIQLIEDDDKTVEVVPKKSQNVTIPEYKNTFTNTQLPIRKRISCNNSTAEKSVPAIIVVDDDCTEFKRGSIEDTRERFLKSGYFQQKIKK